MYKNSAKIEVGAEGLVAGVAKVAIVKGLRYGELH